MSCPALEIFSSDYPGKFLPSFVRASGYKACPPWALALILLDTAITRHLLLVLSAFGKNFPQERFNILRGVALNTCLGAKLPSSYRMAVLITEPNYSLLSYRNLLEVTR